MKKTLLMLVALMSAQAHAAGAYDGIYQNANGSEQYMTVYQAGNVLITTQYANMPANLQFASQAGNFNVSVMDYYSVLNGQITGNQGTVSGFQLFRACSVSVTLLFSGTQVLASIASVASSTDGTAQGVNCPVNSPVGSQITFNKIL